MLEDPGGMEEQTEELVGPRKMEDQEEMEEIKIKELPEEMVEERTVNMKSKSKMERYQELLEKTIQITLWNNLRRKVSLLFNLLLQTRLSATILRMEDLSEEEDLVDQERVEEVGDKVVTNQEVEEEGVKVVASQEEEIVQDQWRNACQLVPLMWGSSKFVLAAAAEGAPVNNL